MNIRVGQGYDSHALVENIPLYVGGYHIDSPIGCKGHSDGDCLLHALIDCLLGALGEGDIGTWFPDNDPAYKGIRSTELLSAVLNSSRIAKFEFINLDITLFLNQPKMKAHREGIKSSLSDLLALDASRINIKAKTWEGFSCDGVMSASVTGLISLL
ncbi:MAG: 2-C-methyl-D-erythritol 2,4-cyclodiphosphate synthase [Planctomycetes bacterium]|nr:2-C-methyl-D-erythritol 2,4-cyclodiphosphate synthase [Planctomycetota bacterium]